MKEIILLKNGEIALKGLNRRSFEDLLIKNAKHKLAPLGKFVFSRAQSTMFVQPAQEDMDLDEAVSRLSKVFGIAALTRACVVEKDFEDIAQKACTYLEEELLHAKTFKVEAKRSDKSFAMNSPMICRELGGVILEKFPHLKVDVLHPEVTVWVEVRDFAAYIHASQMRGAGGIPVGCSGKATLLISGGIDSPVAGYMMAKRGLSLTAVHFASPPYTSERAKQKVVTLLEKVSEYAATIKLLVVPFTDIQKSILEGCPEELFTIIMRRYMMRIAQRLAKMEGCGALITGESVGQVASQTMYALACTDAVCQIPVFRPVIGMDKDEIVLIAKHIDTFETSILPYEDCCTVFTPAHPRTKPKLFMVEQAEETLNLDEMMDKAIAEVETIIIG